jgi:hypothetical protein
MQFFVLFRPDHTPLETEAVLDDDFLGEGVPKVNERDAFHLLNGDLNSRERCKEN